ncbi:hypothetical protein MTP99_007905 [Tenebrio molitor]|jgi:hypothetical protein|nr:hypothetical protein MTP99_007905 [Tenebrio molitor]
MFYLNTAPIPTSLASHCYVKGCSKLGHDKMGALIKAFFTYEKVCSHSGVHLKRVFFLVKLVSGATMVPPWLRHVDDSTDPGGVHIKTLAIYDVTQVV